MGALLGLLAWCWRRCIKQPGQAVRLTGVACLLVLSTQTALYLLANFGLPVHAGFPLPLLAQGNAAFYLYLWMFGLLFCILRAGHVYVGSPLPRRAVAATQASLQS